MGKLAEQVKNAASFLATKSRLRPTVALVLGSGLGAFAKELEEADTIPYQDIPHFPYSTVEGHAGHLLVGRYADVPLAVMVGRVHAYEGYTAQEVVFPARVLSSFGVKTLVVTNAAGAINTAFKPGDLMIISDQLNLTGLNPMRGPEEKELGSRFIDLTEAYHAKLRSICEAAGTDHRSELAARCLRRVARSELRNTGRDPDAQDDGSRRGRHVHGARSDRHQPNGNESARDILPDQYGSRNPASEIGAQRGHGDRRTGQRGLHRASPRTDSSTR